MDIGAIKSNCSVSTPKIPEVLKNVIQNQVVHTCAEVQRTSSRGDTLIEVSPQVSSEPVTPLSHSRPPHFPKSAKRGAQVFQQLHLRDGRGDTRKDPGHFIGRGVPKASLNCQESA